MSSEILTMDNFVDITRKDPRDRLDEVYEFLFQPGKNYITDGERGGGKTHHGVAMAETLVTQPYRAWGKVILITNIIFLRKTAGGYSEDTPENVHHVTTMKDMLRTIGEILKVHGEHVRILVLLDEAQNFMLSDLNADKVNLSLIRLFGTSRKFRVTFWLISPTIRNFVPRVRNYYDEDEPGYMNGIFRKNRILAQQAIAKHKLQATPRDFTTIQYGVKGRPHLIPIPPSKWTRPKEQLKEGEYCYDQLSSADFVLGDDFDLKSFIKAVSDVPFHLIPDTIIQFFEDLENKDDGEEISVDRIIIREKMQTSLRLKEQFKFSGAKTAIAVGMSETTWRRHFNAFLKVKGLEEEEGVG